MKIEAETRDTKVIVSLVRNKQSSEELLEDVTRRLIRERYCTRTPSLGYNIL